MASFPIRCRDTLRPQPVAIDVSYYGSDACNDFSKKIMRRLFLMPWDDGSSVVGYDWETKCRAGRDPFRN